jgi:hypothetical protein
MGELSCWTRSVSKEMQSWKASTSFITGNMSLSNEIKILNMWNWNRKTHLNMIPGLGKSGWVPINFSIFAIRCSTVRAAMARRNSLYDEIEVEVLLIEKWKCEHKQNMILACISKTVLACSVESPFTVYCHSFLDISRYGHSINTTKTLPRTPLQRLTCVQKNFTAKQSV